MQLVIAEKPSVAQSLSRILGVSTRKNGYLEGKKYIVSWCFGHLAGLADASVYNERYAKWKREDLPILPCPFRFEISPDNQRLMAIRSFVKYAAISDPANIYLQAEIAKVPVRKCQSKVVEFFSDNALKALLEQPNRSKKTGLRNSCFMILMYDTGARCQEILDLRIKDLVLNEKSPYVYLTGKGSKTRTVPLMEKTVHHLNLYLNRFHPEGQRNREDYLFYTIIHQQRCTMSPDTVAAFLKKYADQARHSCADIPESVHPHQFRHTRAISWYRNGVPLILVSELLGHADINTSQIYAYADTEMKRKAISKALGDNSSNFQKDDVSRWEGDDELIKKLFALS